MTEPDFSCQNKPGSLYDPALHSDRKAAGIRQGDTDYHEPQCECYYCKHWEDYNNERPVFT